MKGVVGKSGTTKPTAPKHSASEPIAIHTARIGFMILSEDIRAGRES